jgi:RND family efflux transporter MFP subunit
LVGGLAAVLVGCGDPSPEAPPPPAVEVERPVRRDVTQYYRYTGNLESVASVEVRARVSGILEDIHFEVSSPVEAGDQLFTIEPAPYEIAIQSAEAAVQSADAAVELARIERDQVQEAFNQNAANERELEKYKSALKTAEAEHLAAEARLRDAQLQRAYADVVSPIAGRVGRNLVDVGTLVGVSEPTLLTTVTQLDPIYVYFDVSERIVQEYLNRGRDGQVHGEGAPPPPTIEIARSSDEPGAFPFRGEVDYVDSVVDRSTGTLRARGRIANPDGRLFPGLFVRIRAPDAQTPDAVLVREDALSTDLTGPYLLVIDEQDTARRRAVELGERTADGLVVVTQGLEGDERYVTAGIQKARPGQPVTIRGGEGPRGQGVKGPSDEDTGGPGTSVPAGGDEASSEPSEPNSASPTPPSDAPRS